MARKKSGDTATRNRKRFDDLVSGRVSTRQILHELDNIERRERTERRRYATQERGQSRLWKAAKATGGVAGAAAIGAGGYVERRAERKAARGESGYKKGFGEALGKLRVGQRIHHNPFGFTFMVAVVWIFFSIGPIRVLPAVPFMVYVWVLPLIWAIANGNMGYVIIWIILFLAFHIPLVMGVIDYGSIYGEKLGIKTLNPFEYIQEKLFVSYGGWKNPKTREEVKKKGIEFLSFQANRAFAEGSKVRLTSQVQVDGLYDSITQTYHPLTVEFGCYEQNTDGTVRTRGEIYIDNGAEAGSLVKVPAQEFSTYDVSCVFEKGLTIGTTSANLLAVGEGEIKGEFEEGVVVRNKLISKKVVVLEAHTVISQITSLKLYNVQEAYHPTMAEIPDDPEVLLSKDFLATLGANPTLANRQRARFNVRPVCESGCGGAFQVSLDAGAQPITEKKVPALEIEFLKEPNTFGILAQIQSVALALPEGVALETEKSLCDFEPDGSNIRDDVLEKLNAKLKTSIERQRVDNEALPPIIAFECGLTIPSPGQQQGFKELKTRSIFDVIVRDRAFVEIYRDVNSLT